MKSQIFALLFITMLFYGCEKTKPSEDVNGETIQSTCLIEGKKFINFPAYHFVGGMSSDVSMSFYNDLEKGKILSFQSYSIKSDIRIGFSVKFDTINPLQIYEIQYERDAVILSTGRYYLDTLSERQLKITKFDKEKRVISGEFYFKGINRDSTDKISVTEGTFNCYHSYY
jgi:hypothetical protein